MTPSPRSTTRTLRRAAVALLAVPVLLGAAPGAVPAAVAAPTRTDCSAWVPSEFRGLALRVCARQEGRTVTSLIQVRNRTARTQVGAWIIKERTSPEGGIGSGSVASRYRVPASTIRTYTGTETDSRESVDGVIVVGRLFREGEQIGRARVTADYT